ncbi:SGNH/GDSL hydrolase family protein [Streptomyces sp. NPDC048603]|uniref:SGNH/GDSL hydrolase family protein n=1 Tax=Streptomyces sp. NPDC048603 TaxID=3365577 RepID=UPI003720DA51
MPMPPGIATVTLAGRYVHPDGTPLAGTVTISAPALLTLSGADVIAAGAVTVTLDDAGQFTATLIATDNANSEPTDWAYTVTEKFVNVSSRTYSILLPQGTPTVNLADIAPADPSAGNYIPVVGPAGPSGTNGRTILSGTTAPSAGDGANGDFWIDTVAWAIYGPKAAGAWPSGHSLGGGGGGLITSVNGLTGAVVLDAADVGADPAGSAAAAQSAATSAAASYTDGAMSAEVARADAAYATASSVSSLTTRMTTAEGTLSSLSPRAIRRGGIPDVALADPLYSGSAPTISTTQTTTSTISGAVKYAPPLVTLSGSDVRGDFLFLGATDFAIGASAPDTNYALPTSRYPHTYATPQNSWAFEFVTDAPEIELRFKYMSATTSAYRLSIDGRPVTATTQLVGGTTVGSGHMLKVALGSSAVRRIRFDVYNVPFGGIYIGSTYTLWRPVTTRGRLMVLGDSITDGSTQNSGMGVGTWLYKAARMMGVTDAWEQGRGGTGYITASTSAVFGDRLAADIVAYNPDMLVIKGGYNDASGTQSVISSAAAALYSAAKTALPQTQIVVVGPIAPTATPAASISATDTTLREAAAAASLPYVSLVSGETRNRAGTVVSTQNPFVTTANVATVIGADGVHPTDVGHAELARWMVRALAPVLPL